MEKSNIINVVVSLLLIICGFVLLLQIWREQENREVTMLIGVLLMIYGIMRIAYTNLLTKDKGK